MRFSFVLASDTHLAIAREVVENSRHRGSATLVISIKPYFYQNDFNDDELTAISPNFVRSIVHQQKLVERSSIFTKARRRLTRMLRNLTHTGSEIKRNFVDDFNMAEVIFSGDFALICNDRSPVEQFWCNEFRQRNLPVFLLQESIRRDLSMVQTTASVAHGQGKTSHIFAWGNSSREYFLMAGVPESKISVTGSPRIDRFIRNFEVHQRAMDRNVQTGPPVILLCSNPVYAMMLKRPLRFEDFLNHIKMLASWCKNIGAELIWKPHPLELPYLSGEIINAISARYPHLRFDPHLMMEEALIQSSAVIIQNSTVAIESALARRPCGMLFPDTYSHGTDFLERGICRGVSSCKELIELLNIDASTNTESTVAWYVDARPGSTQRILDECAKLVETYSSTRVNACSV